ncbi:MAG TPA: HD domain-containing protein [Vitreimonas sp.]|nr:HD domain-containing protein [Vitreimonas sp.]
MTIAQLYQQYRLMPNLQQHQLRVAGVAAVIVDTLTTPLSDNDRRHVILACLLHDMGNIVKFDLLKFPEFVPAGELEYWQEIQKEFVAKYGHNDHDATMKIIDEIGVELRVYELIDAVGFLKAEENFLSSDLAQKICAYADMRVAPTGVVLLQERLDDLEERYGDKYSLEEDVMKRRQYSQYLYQIEKQIFEVCKIKPEEIAEEAIAAKMSDLVSTTV